MQLNYPFKWVIGLLLCLHIQLHTHAQNYTLQGDTLMSKGIKYLKYTMTTPQPQVIHVLEIDLGDPTLKLQSVKSGDVIDGDTLTVKQLAAAKDVNGSYHNVIGAINGDFYSTSTGNPINLLVADGQLLTDKLSLTPPKDHIRYR